MKRGTPTQEGHQQNAMVAAIKVSAFLDTGEFEGLVDEFVDGLKALPPTGDNEVLVPGEREEAVGRDRLRDGIHLPRGTCDRMAPVAARFGIDRIW